MTDRMGVSIPDKFKDLFEKPVVVSLATLLPSGQPQVHPVWCDWDGEYLRINSAKDRIKDKNMRARKQVTILAMDPKNPYRWLEVRGEVAEITEEGADAHIDDLAFRYLGKRPYPYRNPTETRVMYKIRPVRFQSFG
jgi:PPOX class probable F420-dependent enzyme